MSVHSDPLIEFSEAVAEDVHELQVERGDGAEVRPRSVVVAPCAIPSQGRHVYRINRKISNRSDDKVDEIRTILGRNCLAERIRRRKWVLIADHLKVPAGKVAEVFKMVSVHRVAYNDHHSTSCEFQFARRRIGARRKLRLTDEGHVVGWLAGGCVQGLPAVLRGLSQIHSQHPELSVGIAGDLGDW